VIVILLILAGLFNLFIFSSFIVMSFATDDKIDWGNAFIMLFLGFILMPVGAIYRRIEDKKALKNHIYLPKRKKWFK